MLNPFASEYVPGTGSSAPLPIKQAQKRSYQVTVQVPGQEPDHNDGKASGQDAARSLSRRSTQDHDHDGLQFEDLQFGDKSISRQQSVGALKDHTESGTPCGMQHMVLESHTQPCSLQFLQLRLP